ncbi:DNA replication and repair protein RecF [Frankliniella fusca]|uniref:DNA replication and repair protein RecF n=1 Tax=Frankliniella fusca TaxID=407009 RepID=A0AAE1LFW9_9NEOP|nr:DNA replication and repair protein RecF [Frankliniella fusca]
MLVLVGLSTEHLIESNVRVCCNPYGKHRKPIQKCLREITDFDCLLNENLVAGNFWCDNCRKLVVAVSDQTGSEAQCSTLCVREAEKKYCADSEVQINVGEAGAEIHAQQNLEKALQGPIFSCYDPYKKHKKAITKNLRIISEADAQGNQELVGLYWCTECRIRQLTTEDNQTGEGSHCGASESERSSCADPFKIHNKPVYKGLRVIKESDRERHSRNLLLVGQLWCDKCRKMAPATSETSGSAPSSQEPGAACMPSTQGSGTSPTLSPAIQKERVRQCLNSLGLSPLPPSREVSRSDTSKADVGKRKLEAAVDVVKKKISLALKVNEEDLQSIQDKKAQDHDLLMEEIRKKLPSASRVQKYQLLSLVPDSWPIITAANFFGISRTLFIAARQLKREKGILPIPDFSRASSVNEATKALIKSYYCSDENSKVMPGSRDCVSISKGVYEQKRLLLSNIPELYEAFKNDNDGLKVGKSIFWSLKPKCCVSAGQAGTHEQCVCQTHQNFKLLSHALNMKTYYRNLIALCVCNIEDKSCMLRICDKCPTVEEIEDILKGQIEIPYIPDLPEDEFSSDFEYNFFEETVKFRQWKSVDGRTEMVVEVCSRADLIGIAAKQMRDLIIHDYIACNQRDYLKNLKNELPSNTVIVAMDFAMNYNCLVQGAVQSYHWSPKQATVHPTVIYYKSKDYVVEHKTIIFISDDLDHDVPLVKKIQELTVSFIKQELPHIEEIIYSTDGCACQYKSKGYFLNLCNHEADFGFKASHTYFATSHGKSQCDADGGSVKRKARKASLQRPLDKQIISAKDLYDFCTTEMKDTFIFKFISKVEVEPSRRLYQENMVNLETLPGTRSFHFMKPLNENTIACWRISNDQDEPTSLIHSLWEVLRPAASILYVSNGMYVVVRLAKNRYLAQITDVYHEEKEADVSLLMPKLPSKQFYWPKEIKSATVPLPHIICDVQPMDTDDKVSFTNTDLEKLYNLKIMKRPHSNELRSII